MKAYVIRRLLLMIPTFIGISLILFVVLNLAPGRPGSQNLGDAASDARGEQSEESYRIFREQFFLDKPVVLNTRFALDADDIRAHLERAVGLDPTATADQRMRAQEELEDFGRYAVPHLVRLLDDPNPKVRDSAVFFLRKTALRQLVDPFAPNPSPELRALNAAIDRENAELRALRYAPSDPEDQKLEVVRAWKTWFAAHPERFQFGAWQKLVILFTDTRFARYWQNLLSLDFGVSLVTKEPVVATLLSKLKYSLTLSVTSLLLAYGIAIPLGIFSAVRKNTEADRVVTTSLFMLYSLPSFFVATMLLYFMSEASDTPWLRLFPTSGFQSRDFDERTTLGQIADVAWHVTLPLVCLTYGSLAALSRYMRTGMLDVLHADYVRTARAKGLPERVVVGKHALRNGLLPILTLLAGLLPAVLGGSVIVEFIFGIPGMGLWTIDAIYTRDYNVIMAVELFSTVLVLFGLLLTDLSYALVDPRIRFE